MRIGPQWANRHELSAHRDADEVYRTKAGPWRPKDLDNCVLWVRADGPALAGTADGTSVGTWEDESGNDNDLSQGTAANQPVFKTNILNGKPVLRFDGSNDFIEATSLLVTDSPFTWISINAWDSGGSGGCPLSITSSGSDNTIFGADTDSGSLRIVSRNSASFPNTLGLTSVLDDTFRTVEYIMATERSITGALNGEEEAGLDGDDFNTGANRTTIGRFSDDSPAGEFDGDVAESILVDGLISMQDRAVLYAYLRNKYEHY